MTALGRIVTARIQVLGQVQKTQIQVVVLVRVQAAAVPIFPLVIQTVRIECVSQKRGVQKHSINPPKKINLRLIGD